MDYLVYIEHNAENLQFFLWIQEYTHRWNSKVSEKDRALSPEWIIEETQAPDLVMDAGKEKSDRHGRKRSRSSKDVINMLTSAMGKDDKSFMLDSDEQAINRPDNISFISGSIGASTNKKDVAEAAGMNWQPCKFPVVL